jgi:hypothetical protein
MEKERKNELNLLEDACNDEIQDDDFMIYNNKVMKEEEVSDYKEVQEIREETHQIEKPNFENEIPIIRRPGEHSLNP